MKVVVDEENVPLLGGESNKVGLHNEKIPYQLISTHDIREILKEQSPKREIRNLMIWRICLIVVILSVLGLIATTNSLGIQFYVTSLKSTSTPPTTDESSPLNELMGALRKHPPIGKMTSPRVVPVKSLTDTTEDVDNSEETSMDERESMSNNHKGTKEDDEEEDLSITTDAVVMPGSPSDPSLKDQREKKNSVQSSIATILPAAYPATTTDVSETSDGFTDTMENSEV